MPLNSLTNRWLPRRNWGNQAIRKNRLFVARFGALCPLLSVASVAIVLTSAGLASSYDELAAKGFRWVTVDGPYGCPSKDDLRQITKNRTDEIELRMVEQLRAYCLIPGGIVRLVHQDAASGMSQIHSAGIGTDLWTLTIFLSKRPIKNTYREIETPETSGLIRAETAAD
jgi:hypothetical protein